MIFRTRRPAAPLGDFVEELWLLSDYRPSHDFEHLLPTGAVELVIALGGEPLRCYDPGTLQVRKTVRGPLLSGVRAEFIVIDTRQQREMIGARFRPGGAHALLGIPVDEVQGLDLPLEAIWGAAAEDLQDCLHRENDPDRRLAILERALAARVRTDVHPTIRWAVARLDQTHEPIEIGRMAEDAGWSHRHFIQTFGAQVGITPRTFGRIRRFQATVRRMHAGRSVEWADLALTCGYYDQAHFIRDFKRFSGLTPGAYRPLPVVAPDHVPLVNPPPDQDARSRATSTNP
jgi:AraC-like DNA-binding protein